MTGNTNSSLLAIQVGESELQIGAKRTKNLTKQASYQRKMLSLRVKEFEFKIHCGAGVQARHWNSWVDLNTDKKTGNYQIKGQL